MIHRRLTACFVWLSLVMSVAAAASASQDAALWDTSPPAGGGPELTTQLVANDFTVGSPVSIGRFRFWSLDAFQGTYPGFLGSIYWALYANDPGQRAPGSLVASGLSEDVVRTPTSYTFPFPGYGPITQNDVTIGAVVLPAGDYWLAIHNGPLSDTRVNTFYIMGSALLTGAGDRVMRLALGETSWYAGVPEQHDSAFVLYPPVRRFTYVGAGDSVAAGQDIDGIAVGTGTSEFAYPNARQERALRRQSLQHDRV